MNYPKIIKSRDLPAIKKEFDLCDGGTIQKLSRSRMIVCIHGQMPVVYRRTRKRWIFHGTLTDVYKDFYVWLNEHTNQTNWGRIAVDDMVISQYPVKTMTIQLKI